MLEKEEIIKKIYEKGEKSMSLYANFDYESLSKENKTFLNRLLLFSKYKHSFLRLFKINQSMSNKKRFIELNSNYLSYEDFCKSERVFENYYIMLYNCLYSYFISSCLLSLLSVYRRPTGVFFLKDIVKIFTFNLFAHIFYINYSKKDFSNIVDEVYINLKKNIEYMKYNDEQEMIDNKDNLKSNYFRI